MGLKNNFKRIYIITQSIILIFIFNSIHVSADSLENDYEILTQEQVDKAFTDENYQQKIKDYLKGITNTTLPHSTQTDIPTSNIFIGKKSFQEARIDSNDAASYREFQRNYLIFGGDTVFGILILSNYKGDIDCQYIKIPELITKATKESKSLAAFFLTDSEKYWKLYGVNENNKVYPIMTEEDDPNNLPPADYNTIKSPDYRNAINEQCFIPAYTLEGKSVETLDAGAGIEDQSAAIH